MTQMEKRNLSFRLITFGILLLFLGFIGFLFYRIISLNPEALVLDIVSLSAVSVFCIFEMIIIIRGWKKSSHLYDIAFNQNGTLNSVAFVAVIIGNIIGLGLIIICTIIFFMKDDIDTKCNLLIITSISLYLLLNCIIYCIYLLIFRKREFKLKDLLK